MRLGATVLREIIGDLAAENLVEETALRQQFAVRRRIEPFDGAAQLDQILADVGVAIHRLDRTVEKAVRMARRLQHLLAAHVGDQIGTAAFRERWGHVGKVPGGAVSEKKKMIK